MQPVVLQIGSTWGSLIDPQSPDTLRQKTYNISSSRPFVNRELADAVRAITSGLRLDLRPGRQAGPGDDPYLDTTRLTRDTGFAPAFDVAGAVADYVAWRADNPR